MQPMRLLYVLSTLGMKMYAFMIFLALSFTSCESRVSKLQRQGNNLIQRIEEYKSQKGQLPVSLAAMGVVETESGPLAVLPATKPHNLPSLVWYVTR
jgi:hypothetical protein